MLHFVICDDNEKHNYFIEKWLKKVFKKHDISAELSFMACHAENVLEYARKNLDKVNVYILDIDFNGNLSGLELAREIRKYDSWSYMIFITAYEEHCMQSFKLKTFDFLVKPVTSSSIEQLILNLYNDYKKMQSFEIKVPIKSGASIHMININDIIYFEKCRQILVVHLKNGVIRSYEPLKKVAEELGGYGFLQCHRAFMVNPGHVENISLKDRTIHLSNGEKCSFSKRYRKDVLAYFL